MWCQTWSEQFSHSSTCFVCTLCWGSEDRGGQGDSLCLPETVSVSKAARPLSVTAMTLKTQIKGEVQPPVTAVAFVPNLLLNAKMEGGRTADEFRQCWVLISSGDINCHCIWHVYKAGLFHLSLLLSQGSPEVWMSTVLNKMWNVTWIELLRTQIDRDSARCDKNPDKYNFHQNPLLLLLCSSCSQQKASGKVLFDLVCSHMNLIEGDYFGLEFQNHQKMMVSEDKKQKCCTFFFLKYS